MPPIGREYAPPVPDGAGVALSGPAVHREIPAGTYGAPYWVTIQASGFPDRVVGPLDPGADFRFQLPADAILVHSADPTAPGVVGRDAPLGWGVVEAVGRSAGLNWHAEGPVGRAVVVGWSIEGEFPFLFNSGDFAPAAVLASYFPHEELAGLSDAQVEAVLTTGGTHGFNAQPQYTLNDLVLSPSPKDGGPGRYLWYLDDAHLGRVIRCHRKHYGETFGVGNIKQSVGSITPGSRDIWVIFAMRFATGLTQQAGEDSKALHSDVNRYHTTVPFHRWRAVDSPNPTYSGVLQNGDTEFKVSPDPGWAVDAHVNKEFLLLKSSYDPGASDSRQLRTPPTRADVADSKYLVNAEPEEEWWGTPSRALITGNTSDTLTFERAMDPSSAKLLLDWVGSSAGRKLIFLHETPGGRTFRVEMVQAGFTLDGQVYPSGQFSSVPSPDHDVHPDGFVVPHPFTGLGNVNPPGLGGIMNRILSHGDWFEIAMHYAQSDDFEEAVIMWAFRRLTDDAGAWNPSRWRFRRIRHTHVDPSPPNNPPTEWLIDLVTIVENINIGGGTPLNLPTVGNPLGGSAEIFSRWVVVDGKLAADPFDILKQLNEDPGTNIPLSFPYDLV